MKVHDEPPVDKHEQIKISADRIALVLGLGRRSSMSRKNQSPLEDSTSTVVNKKVAMPQRQKADSSDTIKNLRPKAFDAN